MEDRTVLEIFEDMAVRGNDLGKQCEERIEAECKDELEYLKNMDMYESSQPNSKFLKGYTIDKKTDINGKTSYTFTKGEDAYTFSIPSEKQHLKKFLDARIKEGMRENKTYFDEITTVLTYEQDKVKYGILIIPEAIDNKADPKISRKDQNSKANYYHVQYDDKGNIVGRKQLDAKQVKKLLRDLPREDKQAILAKISDINKKYGHFISMPVQAYQQVSSKVNQAAREAAEAMDTISR